MTSRLVGYLAFLLALPLAAGCEKPSPVEAEMLGDPTSGASFHLAPLPPGATPDLMDRQNSEGLVALAAFHQIVRGSASCSAADAQARATLKTPSTQPVLEGFPALADVAPSFREQSAALFLLHGCVLDEPVSEASLARTAYYTDLLLTHGTPEVQMIERALDRLEGYWDEARWNAAARRTVEIADAYVQRFATCDNCGATNAQGLPGGTQQRDEFFADVAKTAERLRTQVEA